ncbi:prolipoprotein diacylglyceryl transferase [Paracrocinitomix mangrovi]|uniref:prolipoprotein diacylglyceryl transferase n=1 Tax=Paracrocinitomix mangrovi TaxID=2862509 RepID=UPI001C8D3E98|nr:prolipoprotein diacylglyceryl transferase [Paracrocinitomix mangrovi]UKN02764.1 prolipoprotein diacylglyceryl transferase [Paracrocinitomix mangrovi]
MANFTLLEIVWNFHPNVIPGYKIPAWYGIMWALGFYFGFIIVNRMYKSEKVPADWMDKTFMFTLLGGVLGARLGHCFFYQADYYLANPIEIIKIWEGGLASHGGAIGVIITSIFISRKYFKRSVLWVLDRLVVATAMVGGLIRLGNLFNHEIVGVPTGTDSGFKFLRHDIGAGEALAITGENNVGAAYDQIANNPEFAQVLAEVPNRYPAQLYEAIFYFITFGILFFLYWKTNAGKIKGFLLGVFFILVFGFRFFIEFIKSNQADGFMESGLEKTEGLNMGQYLSIPLVLIGLFLTFRFIGKLKKGKDTPVEE